MIEVEKAILEVMSDGNAYTLIDIAEALGISRQLARYHLTLKKNSLRRRGLVRVRSSARVEYHGLGGKRTYAEFEITDKGLEK